MFEIPTPADGGVGMTGSYLFLGGGRRRRSRRLPPLRPNRLKALSFRA